MKFREVCPICHEETNDKGECPTEEKCKEEYEEG